MKERIKIKRPLKLKKVNTTRVRCDSETKQVKKEKQLVKICDRT